MYVDINTLFTFEVSKSDDLSILAAIVLWIFVILVIVTAIIKIKIGKRSVHQREVLLQISYASAS
jgi:hypothetical protein